MLLKNETIQGGQNRTFEYLSALPLDFDRVPNSLHLNQKSTFTV